MPEFNILVAKVKDMMQKSRNYDTQITLAQQKGRKSERENERARMERKREGVCMCESVRGRERRNNMSVL